MSTSDHVEPTAYMPPSPSALIATVAAACEITRNDVDAILRDSGLALRSPLPAYRKIQVLRLRLAGTKHTGEDFSLDQPLGAGLWAIAHTRNSAGKTSLLECLVWPLRGEPRDLPPDVRSWLRLVTVDAIIGGRYVRITIERSTATPQQTTARIMQASSEQELLSSSDAELTTVLGADNAVDVEAVIGAFMLDALGLEHTSIWNSRGGQDGEGATQRHGWVSYFGACYLNPGGDKLLFGDVAQSPSLSARLLELFVAIPYASTLTHIKAIEKRQDKDSRQARQRAEQDEAARSIDRNRWTEQLEATQAEIKSLKQAAEVAMQAELEAADRALEAMRIVRQAAIQADEAHQEAHALRISIVQRAIDVEETWQARRILGLLNPVCCPRCEAPFNSDRRAGEKDDASCAVCTRPMPPADDYRAESVIAELRNEAEDARRVELEAQEAFGELKGKAQSASADYEAARERLNSVSVSSGFQRLRDLELTAARLEGQLSATGSQKASGPKLEDGPGRVIEALRPAVEAVVKQATDEVFPQLDTHIVALAQAFGVENLDSVRIQRNGNINAIKAGKKTPFGEFSRGDRLRMRIAAVIAMLRIGSQLGTHPHPGLVLIDAVGSEEVAIEPGRALVAELQKLASELPDLQIILTTATPELVKGVMNDAHIITSADDHMF